MKLTTEEHTDIREDVFFKMAENRYPILEMQSKKYLWKKSSWN